MGESTVLLAVAGAGAHGSAGAHVLGGVVGAWEGCHSENSFLAVPPNSRPVDHPLDLCTTQWGIQERAEDRGVR